MSISTSCANGKVTSPRTTAVTTSSAGAGESALSTTVGLTVGVADVNEVIQKFLTQEQTHDNLVAMTKDAQARIERLGEERTATKAAVDDDVTDDVTADGSGTVGAARDAAAAESKARKEAEAEALAQQNAEMRKRLSGTSSQIGASPNTTATTIEKKFAQAARPSTPVVEVTGIESRAGFAEAAPPPSPRRRQPSPPRLTQARPPARLLSMIHI